MYTCQQANPDNGDWCQLIDQDFEDINLHINENLIQSMNLPDFKKIVKTCVRNAAFEKLQALNESHSKVENNQDGNLNHPQGYLKSETITNLLQKVLSDFFCKECLLRKTRCGINIILQNLYMYLSFIHYALQRLMY